MALAPPPSQISSPSFRNCDIKSAKKRMFASKRAEVGSIFVVSTLAGADDFTVDDSLRSAMGREMKTRTDYGIPRGQNRAMRRTLDALSTQTFVGPSCDAVYCFGQWVGGNRVD